ncbi:MAG: molybdate ABC transporter substrate-binding protein [Gemmatimonadales bacterium]|nr:molybdate ABC transporter substrate-binding protein [Gemmatimonadales bacterium]MDQ3426393.1 molybdate ABC transporter substrate-binding protein [Gemmatimonadota bacterium]
MSAGAGVSAAVATWLALAPGVWAQAPAPGSTPSALTVFAAASLADAFQELARGLEGEHPGLRVHFNFAGSQQLAVQLEQGARADLLASADRRWMAYAEGRGLVAGEPQLFARNRLVVILPRGNPAQIGRLEDLTRRGVKLVVAAEAVPAGRYSREALRNLAGAPGFPPHYARRVLANVVSEEENVRSVVAKVQLGEADAGMVYRSDVNRSAAPHLRVLDIPDEFNVLASYPVAVLEEARNPNAARAFIRLLLSPAGQRVLQRHGLLPR